MFLRRHQAMLRVVNTRPIATGLFETAPALRLSGGRERSGGRVVFPAPADHDRFEQIELPDHGTLWSYTVQRFAPKSPPYDGPEPFAPFAVGYVELPGACIVESRLKCGSFDELRLGMPMQLTTDCLRTDPDGTQVLIYAFRPVVAAGS